MFLIWGFLFGSLGSNATPIGLYIDFCETFMNNLKIYRDLPKIYRDFLSYVNQNLHEDISYPFNSSTPIVVLQLAFGAHLTEEATLTSCS